MAEDKRRVKDDKIEAERQAERQEVFQQLEPTFRAVRDQDFVNRFGEDALRRRNYEQAVRSHAYQQWQYDKVAPPLRPYYETNYEIAVGSGMKYYDQVKAAEDQVKAAEKDKADKKARDAANKRQEQSIRDFIKTPFERFADEIKGMGDLDLTDKDRSKYIRMLRRGVLSDVLSKKDESVSPVSAMALGSAEAHMAITRSMLRDPQTALMRQTNKKLDDIDKKLGRIADNTAKQGKEFAIGAGANGA
jgi:hypothetical protein